MSDGHDIATRTPERHEVTLRPAEGSNPPDLLQEIVKDIKDSLAELAPIAGRAVSKYIGAKGEEAVVRVQEIKTRIYESIGRLELERQRMIQERNEAMNAHAERMEELETERLRERAIALREVIDCIMKLREMDIVVNLKVIRKAEKAMMDMLETE